MKLEDLKVGMFVKTINKQIKVITDIDITELNLYSFDDRTDYTTEYDDNLSCLDDKDDDIISVAEDYNFKHILWERKELLTDSERKYLRTVIKPFRDKVCYIKKTNFYNMYWYLKIALARTKLFSIIGFDEGESFENLEYGRKYSLEELGL